MQYVTSMKTYIKLHRGNLYILKFDLEIQFGDPIWRSNLEIQKFDLDIQFGDPIWRFKLYYYVNLYISIQKVAQ